MLALTKQGLSCGRHDSFGHTGELGGWAMQEIGTTRMHWSSTVVGARMSSVVDNIRTNLDHWNIIIISGIDLLVLWAREGQWGLAVAANVLGSSIVGMCARLPVAA